MIILKNIKAQNLLILPKFGFSTKPQSAVLQNINATTEKVRLKQSVADVKKLQSYLQENRTSKNLSQAINRTAKYDEEFKTFLDGYKKKNREFANIIDLSHYNQDQNVSGKTQQNREEEIRMLEEFRKRKERGSLHIETEASSKILDSNTNNTYDELVKRQVTELYSGEDFAIIILARDSTTLVTKLNRVNHFRYLIFMGNCNGVIGYGKGKGNDFESALNDALQQCKKNLIALNLDHFRTLTAASVTKFNGLTLTIEPRDSMNAWGSPLMGYMLMLAGVSHCRFNIQARNMSNYNLVYAFFKAMTNMKTPKQMAEIFGQKVYHQSFAPWKYSNHPSILQG